MSKGNLFEDRTVIDRIQKELEADFIPDLYDKSMTKVFGEKYYEAEQDSNEEEEIEAERDIDLKLMRDAEIDDVSAAGSDKP